MYLVFGLGSWFHPPITWNLSGWWTDLSNFYRLPGNWNSFFYENFVEVEISDNPKVQVQVNTSGVLLLVSDRPTNRRVLMEDDTFFIVKFSILFILWQLKNSTCLNSTTDYVEVHNTQCILIPSDTYHHFLRMQTSVWKWLLVTHFVYAKTVFFYFTLL